MSLHAGNASDGDGDVVRVCDGRTDAERLTDPVAEADADDDAEPVVDADGVPVVDIDAVFVSLLLPVLALVLLLDAERVAVTVAVALRERTGCMVYVCMSVTRASTDPAARAKPMHICLHIPSSLTWLCSIDCASPC
jgi:hypothetical protein